MTVSVKTSEKMNQDEEYVKFLHSSEYDPSGRSAVIFESDWRKLSNELKRLRKKIEEREKELGKSRNSGNG